MAAALAEARAAHGERIDALKQEQADLDRRTAEERARWQAEEKRLQAEKTRLRRRAAKS
jgi:hypothetical protein